VLESQQWQQRFYGDSIRRAAVMVHPLRAFVSTPSHELRTPLTSILGFSSALSKQYYGPLNSKQNDYVSRIYESGQHLLALINDLLDLSKIEAGKMELDLTWVSVQSLCNQCLRIIQLGADNKRLALSLELDGYLDNVLLDERRVFQMVINLLSNGVKFTPEGGQVKLSSRLASGRDLEQETRPDNSPVNPQTPYLCLEVTDTGIGIPKHKQSLLFQPFRQIDASLNRQHEGTGLGLALTKRLAELHGGTLSFDSEAGIGSRFCIWLPVIEIPEQGQ
jgi:signal transduction histidine kinase